MTKSHFWPLLLLSSISACSPVPDKEQPPAPVKSHLEQAAEAVVAGCKLALEGDMSPAMLAEWARAQDVVLDSPIDKSLPLVYDKALLFSSAVEEAQSQLEVNLAAMDCAA